MKTDTYFQQFKTNLFHGGRIIVVPTLLIDLIILLFLAMGLDQAMWDVEFIGGVIMSLLIITPFLLISLLGIVIISLIISSNKQLSNITVFILGAVIGIVIVTIGNYVSILFELDEFTALPSVSTIFLLAYVGQKMNSQANLVFETGLEFRAVLWMALIAFAGSFAFALTRGPYFDILSVYISLGHAVSISLPVAILAGFLIGFNIKKI